MKRSQFTEAQITFALSKSETGTRVVEICRQMGVSQGDIFQLEEKIRWFWVFLNCANCGRRKMRMPTFIEEMYSLFKRLLLLSLFYNEKKRQKYSC